MNEKKHVVMDNSERDKQKKRLLDPSQRLIRREMARSHCEAKQAKRNLIDRGSAL